MISLNLLRLCRTRVHAVGVLLDRSGALLDDIAGLRAAAGHLADDISSLSASAAGIDASAALISEQIAGLAENAKGIDDNTIELRTAATAIAAALPAIERLVDIVDPLENTVTRLARLTDRIPGSRKKPPATPPPLL